MATDNQPDLLSSIFELAPQAIVTIDRDGTVLSFSPAGETLFGYHHEDIEGQPIGMLMPDVPSLIKEAPDGGPKRHHHARLVAGSRVVQGTRKDGSHVPLKVTLGEASHDDSDVVLGFIEDLTHEQTMRHELNQALVDVERYARLSAMGEMAASIAHDLNQPLTGAMTSVDTADIILEREGHGEEHLARERIAQCLRDLRRAADLIRHVQSFLKTGEPQKRLVDLNGIVRDGLTLAVAGSDPQIQVNTDFDAAIPSVMIDPVEIQQVVINLVRNAVDALKAVKDKRLAVTSAITDNGEVTITVADSGVGIDDAVADQVFEPLFTDKPGGLGLGLTIARRIARAHDGQITAHRDGDMTLFTLHLPSDPSPDEGAAR